MKAIRKTSADRSEWQPLAGLLRSSWCARRLYGHPRHAMSIGDLKILLDDVPDTLEIVLRRRDPAWSLVLEAWRDAAEEATGALDEWRRCPGRDAYAAF